MAEKDDTDFKRTQRETNSLRHEFGLPALICDSNAPPVDLQLLSAFARNEQLEPPMIEIAVDRLSRFESWRSEYTRLVIEHHRQAISLPTPPVADPE